MAKPEILTVDFTRGDDVLQILPRPALRTSRDAGWNGIYVEEHYQPAWETPEYRQFQHVLLIHGSGEPVAAERMFDGHRRAETIGGENNIVIIPSMVEHQASWNQESPFSLVLINPDRLNQVAYESTGYQPIELISQHAMSDPFIQQMGRSLTAELAIDQLGSNLFVESLAAALSVHLLRQYSTWQRPLRQDINGLSSRQLQRAIDYIQAYLATNLTVESIATELAMSQYHFARLFKQSLGIAPYQYVIQQRVDRAQLLLRSTTLSVSAIANQVGFSSQSQMAVQFRRQLGITPNKYRQQ
jgi:AraC family transcriptional regulator